MCKIVVLTRAVAVIGFLSFSGTTFANEATKLDRRGNSDNTTLKEVFDVPGWEYIAPTELEKYQTLWAVSDIHGELVRFKKLLLAANL